MSLAEKMKETGVISLILPPLSEADPMFAKKKKLLHTRNIQTEFQLPSVGSSSPSEALQMLDKMVRAARILHMDEIEIYFYLDDEFGPFSPRNELESLNSVLSVINRMLLSAMEDGLELLQVLRDKTIDMIKSFGANYSVEKMVEQCSSGPEDLLLQWGKNLGVTTKLQIAYFEGVGRGAVAVEDINIGDTALEIPESLIICEDDVYESDMFYILKDMDGISAETMLLLWSMKERYNANSKFKIYFETLPNAFNTGLSFGLDALSILEGSLLFEEILQAREHLRGQYHELCSTLCTNHPDIFPPELYTWEQFLWACELWYSNGMKVVFTDGKLRTCLVPIAGLLNHSLCPHILHYGIADSATKSLKFRVSRPCKGGEQCYLSYGRLSGSHLVTFYGFLPKGDNPYDIIPLDIDTLQAEDAGNQSTTNEPDWTTHMVRGTWLSNNQNTRTYGLPSPLLAHLRAALRENDSPLSLESSGCITLKRHSLPWHYEESMEAFLQKRSLQEQIPQWIMMEKVLMNGRHPDCYGLLCYEEKRFKCYVKGEYCSIFMPFSETFLENIKNCRHAITHCNEFGDNGAHSIYDEKWTSSTNDDEEDQPDSWEGIDDEALVNIENAMQP